jgi:signal transduction histidine kinase
MIEQLLDLRRLEAGLLALEISHFDLAEVVRRIAHDVQLTTVSHNIIVEADRTVIRADRRRIEEVVVNLLDNARKYSPAGGRIWVRVHPDLLQPSGRQSVILSVSDEGPGIPASERERIFERFYQGAGRLHKGRAGLGIGLYVSRELVRRHGGEIWASSEEGHGATFIVRLPVEGPPSAD